MKIVQGIKGARRDQRNCLEVEVKVDRSLRGRIPFKRARPGTFFGGARRGKLLSFNAIHSSHIWSQYQRNFNRSVGLLEVFQDGHHSSPDG